MKSSKSHVFGKIAYALLVATCLIAKMPEVCAAVGDVQYRGVVINLKTNKVQVNPSKSIRKRSPDAHSNLCDVFDNERKTDLVMFMSDQLAQWHEYKLLGQTSYGDVVFHQEYDTKNPAGAPWADFLLSKTSEGEKPSIAKSAINLKQRLECLYLVYVYRSGDLMEIAYDSSGAMGRSELLEANGITSFFHGLHDIRTNMSKYEFPEVIQVNLKKVPLTAVIEEGLNKVDFAPAPERSPLERVFLIRQYDSARQLEVTSYDAKGKQLDSRVCQFLARPLDSLVAKKFKVGKVH